MRFKPSFNRCLIKEVEEEFTGSIITNMGKVDILKGTIIAVGQGNLLQSGEYAPMLHQVGQVVMFPSAYARAVKIDNEKYFVVDEQDIWGVYEA